MILTILRHTQFNNLLIYAIVSNESKIVSPYKQKWIKNFNYLQLCASIYCEIGWRIKCVPKVIHPNDIESSTISFVPFL